MNTEEAKDKEVDGSYTDFNTNSKWGQFKDDGDKTAFGKAPDDG